MPALLQLGLTEVFVRKNVTSFCLISHFAKRNW